MKEQNNTSKETKDYLILLPFLTGASAFIYFLYFATSIFSVGAAILTFFNDSTIAVDEVNVRQVPALIFSLSFLLAAGWSFAGYVKFYQFVKGFKSFQELFTMERIKYFEKGIWFWLISTFFFFVMNALTMVFLINAGKNAEIEYPLSEFFMLFILSAVAKAFKEAARLKEENSLTV